MRTHVCSFVTTNDWFLGHPSVRVRFVAASTSRDEIFGFSENGDFSDAVGFIEKCWISANGGLLDFDGFADKDGSSENCRFLENVVFFENDGFFKIGALLKNAAVHKLVATVSFPQWWLFRYCRFHWKIGSSTNCRFFETVVFLKKKIG